MENKNQIYNAFIEAGLKSEANCLSKTDSKKKIIPGLGHYIALLDADINRNDSIPSKLFSKARNELWNHLDSLVLTDSKKCDELIKNIPEYLR